MEEKDQRGNEYITEEFKKKVGKLLKEQRVTLNRTQEEVAAKLGIHAETVRRWESGTSFPSPQYRRALIRLLKLRKDTFSPSMKQTRPNTGGDDEGILPTPILRTYRGRRTGDYLPLVPGQWPRYDYEEKNLGAGETYVTVNGYPIDFFNMHKERPFSRRLDWAHIGEPAENLAVSLLADYFGEYSFTGKESEPEKYQSVLKVN